MKTIICIFLLFSVFVSCDNPTSTTNKSNKVVFQTENNSYSKTDSINLIIDNQTDFNFVIALRCSSFLEMYFQKMQGGVWSENLWFPWMSYKCPTFLDTLQLNDVFHYSIEAGIFDSSGTYRLVLDSLIVSNTFVIQ